VPTWIADKATQVTAFLDSQGDSGLVKTLIVVVLGVALARLLSRGLAALSVPVTGAARARVVQTFTWYALLCLVIANALRGLGFDLSVLLGAAGVVTVALSFASQTSASNVISGLFLVAEAAFQPGDTIDVDGVSGEVLSIDLLSVKLRTFDNRYVRLPNENLVKARITNLSRLPLRRFDIDLAVDLDTDLVKVEALLGQLAANEPGVLADPPPLFDIRSVGAKGTGPATIGLRLSCWVMREDMQAARLALLRAVLVGFPQAGIDLRQPA